MMDRQELAKLQWIQEAIAILEGAILAFERRIGRPLYVEGERGPQFRYANRSPVIIIVLKAVRVVSGLNALTVLLRQGYVVEMGVIFRTVDDFLAEIMFVEEALRTEQRTAGQQRFIDQFFEDETVNVQALIEREGRGPARVTRREMQASEARRLGEAANPDRVRRLARTLDDVYSRYVHGAFTTAMELYVGGDDEGFRLRGMPAGSPPIAAYRKALANFAHESLNAFASIAHGLGVQELAERLIDARRTLEASPAYRD